MPCNTRGGKIPTDAYPQPRVVLRTTQGRAATDCVHPEGQRASLALPGDEFHVCLLRPKLPQAAAEAPCRECCRLCLCCRQWSCAPLGQNPHLQHLSQQLREAETYCSTALNVHPVTHNVFTSADVSQVKVPHPRTLSCHSQETPLLLSVSHTQQRHRISHPTV